MLAGLPGEGASISRIVPAEQRRQSIGDAILRLCFWIVVLSLLAKTPGLAHTGGVTAVFGGWVLPIHSFAWPRPFARHGGLWLVVHSSGLPLDLFLPIVFPPW